MLVITTPTEYNTIINREVPTLLKFQASWCAPCRILSATMMSHQIPHVTVDIDSEELHDIIQELNIRSIPVLILFKQGKEIGRLSGLQSAGAINEFVANHQPT